MPLRDRKNDIKTIFEFYVNKYSLTKKMEIKPDVFKILENHQWPGNIRELKNIAERMVILSANDSCIDTKHIPESIKNPTKNLDTDLNKSLEDTLKKVEISVIKNALEKCAQNKTKAAELLGLPPSTLRTKMEKHNLL